jgi:hypothetical protein
VVGEVGDPLLGRATLGHVETRAQGRGDPPVVAVDQPVAPFDDADLAIARQQPVLGVLAPRVPARHHLIEGHAPLGALVGRQAGLEPVAADELAVAVAQQLVAGAVEHGDPPVAVEREHDRAGDVEVALGAVALRAQRLLGGVQRRDVDQDALREQRAPLAVANDRVALPHVQLAPVGGQHAELALELALLAEHARGLVGHAQAVLGVHEPVPEPLVGEEGLGRVAEQGLHLRADPAQRARLVEVRDVGDGGDVLDEAAVALGGVAKRAHRDGAVGGVVEDRDHLDQPAGAVAHRRERQLDLGRRAVRAASRQDLAPRLAGAQRLQGARSGRPVEGPRAGAAERTARRHAAQALEGGVHVDQRQPVGARVSDCDPARHGLQRTCGEHLVHAAHIAVVIGRTRLFVYRRSAKRGCAWSRYQPNARSTRRPLPAPSARSASVSASGGSAGISRCRRSARRNAGAWASWNAA